MNKRFPIYALVALIVSAFAASCNKDDDDYVATTTGENAVMVSTFALQKNDSILANLDSVFFSIDLDRAMVFNADSLPRGTKVDRLVVDMTFSSVSKAEITMPGSDGNDTVVNYLRNATDSINFSRGSVKLHLESANGEYKRDYTIYVNVHKIDPDLLAWNEMASTQLPSSLTAATAQHTVEYQGKVLCFTTDGSKSMVASAEIPGTDAWQMSEVTLPADVNINTLTAGTDALYVCTNAGALYTSADGGSTWTDTGASMNHIYGVMDGKVIGVTRSTSAYNHTTYPASTETPVASDFPVSGTSTALVFTTEWSTQPMMIIAGGRAADGNTLSGAAWAYDGTEWACISIQGFTPLESPVVVPYFAYKTSSAWRVTQRSVLLAFNGLDDNGVENRTMFISYDRGVHWAKASAWMEIPDDFKVGVNSQAIVVNTPMSIPAPKSARWNAVAAASIPVWYQSINAPQSRATAPITEWDCPYIYVFGGQSASGTLYNQIWRGVINRLQFKPLQ